jgi:hypothetical protein
MMRDGNRQVYGAEQSSRPNIEWHAKSRGIPRSLGTGALGSREEADNFFQEERSMKKLALMAAAAAFLAPALISSASAETASVNVRVGSPGYRAYSQERVVVAPSHCRTTTVRTKRANGSVSIRKIRKCG